MFKLLKKLYAISIVLIMAIMTMFACNKAQKGNLIEPLYTAQDMNNLQDGIYRVTLNANDIKEENGKTYFTPDVYSEDLYDTVEIHNLKVGDRVFNRGKEELVESIHWDKSESRLCINFPSFDEAEEVYIPSESGGTYYIELPDGHHSYSLRGKAKILVDDKLILKDSSQWGEPEKSIALKDIKSHIAKGYENDFNVLSTYLRVENGKVVEFVHHYIP